MRIPDLGQSCGPFKGLAAGDKPALAGQWAIEQWKDYICDQTVKYLSHF
jgi:hypothetical protein